MAGAEDSTGDRADVDVSAIREHLQGTSVRFAVLFGSLATGDVGPDSDVDVAVAFSEDTGPHERFDRRNRIDADLQRCVDRRVEVSDLDRLPTEVAYRVLNEGHLLVGNEEAFEAVRRAVEREYEATASVRRERRRQVVDELAGDGR